MERQEFGRFVAYASLLNTEYHYIFGAILTNRSSNYLQYNTR